MKKIAITLSLLLFIGLAMSYGQCNKSKEILSNKGCCSKAKAADCKSKTQIADTEVMVYYFHATRRCATCESVEKVSKETLKDHYKGKVAFKSYNREEDANKALVEKYKVSGQTLLLIKGDQVEDLTTKAFLYAKNDPEKLQKELISRIDQLMD